MPTSREWRRRGREQRWHGAVTPESADERLHSCKRSCLHIVYYFGRLGVRTTDSLVKSKGVRRLSVPARPGQQRTGEGKGGGEGTHVFPARPLERECSTRRRNRVGRQNRVEGAFNALRFQCHRWLRWSCDCNVACIQAHDIRKRTRRRLR